MLRPYYVSTLALCMTLSMAACGDSSATPQEDDAVDPIDECVFCNNGKADAFGIERESYLAYGILELANTASEDVLDDDVGLDSRAASNIVAQRPFFFIEELDTVSYVGKIAFEKMSDYAAAQGYVPSCGDGGLQGLIEACDDGNTSSGDGCSATCTIEEGAGPMLPVLPDVHGVAQPTYMSLAMLELVHTASQSELDDVVGLDARAASGIVSQRPFADLAELDAVSYVGASAFGKLVDYINANGLLGACGDRLVQSTLETCDDGNTNSGDGCSNRCVVEAGGSPLELRESEHLIKGSEINLNVPFIKEDAYYFRERPIETNGLWSTTLVDIMTRMDGIIANETADGAVSYDELAIFSQSPFYDVLLPNEKQSISKIWSFYEVPVSEIVDIPRQETPSLYRMEEHHERAGKLQVYPLRYASWYSDPTTVQALQRTQNIQGNDLDNDKDTVEIDDFDKVLGDLRPAFTQGEIDALESVREAMLDESEPGAGALALRFESVPRSFSPDVSHLFRIDNFQFQYYTDRNFSYYLHNTIKGIDFYQTARSELHVNYDNGHVESISEPRGADSTVYRLMRLSNGAEPEHDFEGVYLFERWVNDRRTITKLVDFSAPLRRTIFLKDGLYLQNEVHGDRYDIDLRPHHVLYALEMRDGTPLNYYVSDPHAFRAVGYELTDDSNDSYSSGRPVTTESPHKDQWPLLEDALAIRKAGRYEPFEGYVLELYMDSRHHMLSAAIFKEGSDTPCLFEIKGGWNTFSTPHLVKYQTMCDGTRIEITNPHQGDSLILTVGDKEIGTTFRTLKLRRDHTFYEGVR